MPGEDIRARANGIPKSPGWDGSPLPFPQAAIVCQGVAPVKAGAKSRRNLDRRHALAENHPIPNMGECELM